MKLAREIPGLRFSLWVPMTSYAQILHKCTSNCSYHGAHSSVWVCVWERESTVEDKLVPKHQRTHTKQAKLMQVCECLNVCMCERWIKDRLICPLVIQQTKCFPRGKQAQLKGVISTSVGCNITLLPHCASFLIHFFFFFAHFRISLSYIFFLPLSQSQSQYF